LVERKASTHSTAFFKDGTLFSFEGSEGGVLAGRWLNVRDAGLPSVREGFL